jgi:hypothetical protein
LRSSCELRFRHRVSFLLSRVLIGGPSLGRIACIWRLDCNYASERFTAAMSAARPPLDWSEEYRKSGINEWLSATGYIPQGVTTWSPTKAPDCAGVRTQETTGYITPLVREYNKMEESWARIGEFAAAAQPRRLARQCTKKFEPGSSVGAVARRSKKELNKGGLRLVFKGGYLQRQKLENQEGSRKLSGNLYPT